MNAYSLANNAYLMKDRRENDEQERIYRQDLIVEQMSDEVLEDAALLTSVIADLNEDDLAVWRLAKALLAVYHDKTLISETALQLRVAVFALIQRHCRAVLV